MVNRRDSSGEPLHTGFYSDKGNNLYFIDVNKDTYEYPNGIKSFADEKSTLPSKELSPVPCLDKASRSPIGIQFVSDTLEKLAETRE